jgi:hypothetical protein
MTIFYLNPLNLPVASGGVQKLHDHVEILNDAGIDAAIINPPAFRPWWFNTRARIVRAPVTLKRGDLLAIPEVYGDALPNIAPGFPRVSVNQNSFTTFENVKRPDDHPYLRCPSLLGILTMSEHDRRYLASTFPNLYVNRAYYSINPELFGFAEGPRQKKIAYMPRKRKQLAAQIIGSLYARHALDGWVLEEIRGMSHAQVSDVLGTSQLFLSFSQREGFGLPPAEALGRGCYVIGYAGWGGNEFFDAAHSQLVLEDDLEGFVSAVADWIANRGWDADIARAGSRKILQTYSPEIERNSVVDFFQSIHERQSAACPETAQISVRELVVPARGPLGLMASRVKSGIRRVVDRVAA